MHREGDVDPSDTMAFVDSTGGVTEPAEGNDVYRQSLTEAKALLGEARKNDVYDEDGFEIEKVSMEDRYAALIERRGRARNSGAGLQDGSEAAQEQKHIQWELAHTYAGNDAIISGFWAADRLSEERIDPDNMRIYTFRTYKKRFPFEHSWTVESMWKKLPIAPKEIRKRKAKSLIQDGEDDSNVLFEDEYGRPLFYGKDSNGYYHLGTDTPTPEEMYAVSHPRETQMEVDQKGEPEKKRPSAVHYASQLKEIKGMLASEKAADKKNAELMLEQMVSDLRGHLKEKPHKTGKASVSVHRDGHELDIFNADLSKVTGRAVKRRLTKTTGIPLAEQQLFIDGREMDDMEHLSHHVADGEGVLLELSQRVHQDAHAEEGKHTQQQSPAPYSTALQKKKLALAEKQRIAARAARTKEAARAILAEFGSKKAEESLGKNPEGVKELSSLEMSADDTAGTEATLPQPEEPLIGEEPNEGDEDAKIAKDTAELDQEEKAAADDARELFAESLKRQENQKAQGSSMEEIQEEEKPRIIAKPTITRRVLYARGDDGSWHIEKEELATKSHAISSDQDDFFSEPDEGMSVQERFNMLEKERVQLVKENMLEQQASRLTKTLLAKEQKKARQKGKFEYMRDLLKGKKRAKKGKSHVQRRDRRVDQDQKLYTWSQFTHKHAGEPIKTVLDMWKKLPTEQRMKQLGEQQS